MKRYRNGKNGNKEKKNKGNEERNGGKLERLHFCVGVQFQLSINPRALNTAY